MPAPDDPSCIAVDARGLLCPLPVLRLRKALADLPPGGRVTLWASDPMASVDVPHFCAVAGHAMIHTHDLDGGGQAYVVQRGALRAESGSGRAEP
ncbi:sulfurtransferase TusA family protein [Paracoccus sp. 2205BS29-5]|uniref:Sulfurtransferase TusA family protein n=2 Tax=Paracoccus spongiarum TaxID=3064387 RepID=A0ABT9JA56_9RHOB|nr:sulfurtransferase TusA family protein [Paracoccus sp. 2205BS29-5]MDP5306697.1 sulfurtransferase TusA family protein [Paracoccus sp. 2205BS29-5]